MWKQGHYPLTFAIALFALLLTVLPLTVASPFVRASLPADPPADHATVAASTTEGVVINEVLFNPSPGGSEWVELRNNSASPQEIAGYSLTDGDGNWYAVPDDFPPVPPGAFVTVYFDGQGSVNDDYNFNDNAGILHGPPGLINIFDDLVDQTSFYNSLGRNRNIINLPMVNRDLFGWNPQVPNPPDNFPPSPLESYVAWGESPASQANVAAAAGLWNQDQFVNIYRGLGFRSPQTALTPGESIGRLPGSANGYPDAWVIYQQSEITPGADNVLPVIVWYYPPAGATVEGNTFTVSWMPIAGATGYKFQLDDSIAFDSPISDVTLTESAFMPTTPIPDGTYFWRARAVFGSGESPWSPGFEIRSIIPPPGLAASKTLGITWKQQRKDTNMLCLDGDAESGNQAWNAPHGERGIHGRNYCVRASVSMLASYYGGQLSQDRITYEIFKGGGPDGDLGHDTPVSYAQADNAVNWAMGQQINRQDGKPTFAQIKGWIDANQPIGSTIPGHMRVIDGYWEFSLGPIQIQFLHILDPWDRPKWISYADDDIQAVWVGPAGAGGAPAVRSDEDLDGDNIADTIDDSDGDGVTDFDERNRFALNPNDNDTDNDLVADGADIREYVFDANGAYSLRNPDADNDGLRKELDKDNDYAANNGLIDGCEDGNQNGIYEATAGETDNFQPTDDIGLHAQLVWPLLGSDVDLHLIRPGGTIFTANDVYYANRSPDWGLPGVACDNPTLDIDCITSCTVENIRLGRLESGTYSVQVHYFSDRGLGPTEVVVRVWIQGELYSFGPQRLTNRQIWEVARVDWPSRTVTPGNQVINLGQGAGLRELPAK